MAENRKEDELSKMLDETLTLEPPPPTPPVNDDSSGEEEDDDNEGEEEEFEFSFMGGDLGSPVSAEEVFKDGQFRIVSPFPGEDEASSTTTYDPKVKKVFVVKNEEEAEAALTEENGGAYCVWKSPVPEMSQKSNSTGFSKLWKVRDLLARSNSDGKDAFVFLTGKSDETTWLRRKKKEKKAAVVDTAALGGERKDEKKKEKKDKKKKKSAFEELYGGGGDKKKSGGKSYLPYRQDLVGFFTSGSSLSRNVHPY